ncbi:hypothetical protein CROQUDRAFT_32734, partial [Cronartium quercuum f. sp. fusiforme G11]
PVETLHMILLGLLKYFYHEAMDEIPKSNHEKIHGRWASFDYNGLSRLPIQPKTLIQHYKSLVGKE